MSFDTADMTERHVAACKRLAALAEELAVEAHGCVKAAATPEEKTQAIAAFHRACRSARQSMALEAMLVRRHLAELFLELVIDRDMQVAFTRQADTGDLEVPLLLRRAQLTFIDSVLVLYLRQRLTQADAHGERAVVALDEMVDNLTLYERAASTDRAGFAKRVHASVEKVKKHNILQKIRASEDRYEISPTLKLLFSAEEIQTLTALYRRMAAGDAVRQQPLSIDEDEDDA